MARVTIEDCTAIIPSRFELVALAAQRAKEISSGARITVERDKDKNPVVALREIANGNLTLEGMRESLIKKLQRKYTVEDQNTALDDNMTRTEITEEMRIFSDEVSEDEFDDEIDLEEELEEEV